MTTTTIHHTSSSQPLSSAEIFLFLSRIVDYLFGIVYGIMAFRLTLELFNASESNPFKAALNWLSDPFVGPFIGLFEYPFSPRWALAFSYFVAFCVLLFIEAVIKGFLRLFWMK